MTEEVYVVVSTISTFKHRYVVPLSELQNLDGDNMGSRALARELVSQNSVKEFSQEHLGENIENTTTMNQVEVLELFDEDNKYLSGWSEEQKLTWIQKWKESWT